jgi:GNAT superfamily N-acetyltransferase
MPLVHIEQLGPSDVSDELTRYLQVIALSGWSKALPERSLEELQYRFNPFTAEHIKEVHKIYQQFAGHGGLFTAVPTESSLPLPVGFLLLHEEVSGNPAEQHYKRLFHPGKVYAHARHLAVAARWQRQGVATHLLHRGLSLSVEQEIFKEEQIPTGHAFAEDVGAIALLGKSGYKVDPPDQQPNVIEGYFGPNARPVEQYRHAGINVATVIKATQPKD